MLIEALTVLALHSQVALPPGPVDFYAQPCPDATSFGVAREACASAGADGSPPEVFIAPTAGRHVALHELGHVFDYTVMRESERAAFMAAVGRTGSWRQEMDSPHEQFAEAYAFCATNLHATASARRWAATEDNWTAGYGYEPTRVQYKRACSVIRRAARLG